MAEYKLYYFNAKARAEIIRLIFAAAGQKYEDIRFEREQWPEYKQKAPLGQAPFLEVELNGNTFKLGQSVTIARYVARKFNLAGKGDEEQAEVEMYGDQVSDLLNELVKVHFEKDETRQNELRKKFHEEILPNTLKTLDGKIAHNGSGYLVASGLTWADLFLVNILEWLGDKKEAALANFSNLKSLDEKVRSHPRIAEWLEKRPKTEM
uniref:Glutathione S-transferase S1-2 n=1 Tax=Brachionus calyciflorus TaxID=104777 RepID=A0A3G2JSE2_9BILA|nr:glutathione S-transferase S1-2 [Brachionus calyciflorus]